MPVFALPEEHVFPNPTLANPDGLLAVGGDLDPGRLLLAYSLGIFPWYGEGQPILWHSPDPRFVLFLDELVVPRSLRKVLRREPFTYSLDDRFADVLDGCATTPRPGQEGTWLTADMRQAYLRLHRLGFAHSVEVYREGVLVAGLYGVCLGRMFFGESMYTQVDDGSKAALVCLVHTLRARGFDLLDSQVHTRHLERFGAREIPRGRYLALLRDRVHDGDPAAQRGRWTVDPAAVSALARLPGL